MVPPTNFGPFYGGSHRGDFLYACAYKKSRSAGDAHSRAAHSYVRGDKSDNLNPRAEKGKVPSNVHKKVIVRKVHEFLCTFIFDFLVNEELFVCAIVFDLSCRMLVFLIASFGVSNVRARMAEQGSHAAWRARKSRLR